MNLTSFLPKPFTMTCGNWEITSPVPTVEAGKLITAFQAMQAEQARRIDAGEPPLNDSEVEGIPTSFDELAPIVLGAEQVTALEADGCPPAYIHSAAFAAVIYWANGGSEAAVAAYLATIDAAGRDAKNTLDQAFKDAAPKARTRKPSKNGRRTA